MSTDKNQILDKQQILQKVKRIAYEIYEKNYKEKEIVIAGLDDLGYVFGLLLEKEIVEISPLKVTMVKISLDKVAATQSEVKLDVDIASLKGNVWLSPMMCSIRDVL
jgi:pyrimidine operon attenuation protein/uracil phosphoribosyltransferase